MILIESIKSYEIDYDEAMIDRHSYNEPFRLDDGGCVDYRIVQELVRGRRFIRPDGEMVVIGCSEQVGDIIDIQYEAWDEANRLIEEWRTQYVNLKLDFDIVRRAGFITRLKWLFFGVD